MVKLYDFKTVSTKLTQKEAADFLDYCNKKGINQSKEIRRLINDAIKEPLPVNLAGKNQFVYNPAKDNFSWRVILDKEIISYIEDDVPSEFLEQLRDALNLAIEERNTFLQKEKEDSVAIPSKILRKGMR